MAQPPKRSFSRGGEIVTDPAELARATERDRQRKATAVGQIGCEHILDIPLPLLARYVVELPDDDRQAFLDALVAQLAPDALGRLADAARERLDAPPAA